MWKTTATKLAIDTCLTTMHCLLSVDVDFVQISMTFSVVSRLLSTSIDSCQPSSNQWWMKTIMGRTKRERREREWERNRNSNNIKTSSFNIHRTSNAFARSDRNEFVTWAHERDRSFISSWISIRWRVCISVCVPFDWRWQTILCCSIEFLAYFVRFLLFAQRFCLCLNLKFVVVFLFLFVAFFPASNQTHRSV